MPIGAWSPTDPDELPGESELPDLTKINATEPAFWSNDCGRCRGITDTGRATEPAGPLT